MENGKLDLVELGNILSKLGAVKVKKEKTPKIICNVDGELISFKNEKELKKFIWKERPETIIKYDLVGEVVVPFDLQVISDKTEKKITE